VLFLHGVQLVQRSSILTVLILNEVDITLEYAEMFGSVLSGEGGSDGDGWRCCRSAPSLPQLPPATPKNPTPFIASLLFFCGEGSNQYSTRTTGGKPIFVWLRSGEERAILV